jgi:uncharacterized protein DUF4446
VPHLSWLDRIDPQVIDLAALAGAALGLLALLLALGAHARVRRLRRLVRRGGAGGEDGLGIFGTDDAELRAELERSRQLVEETRAYLAESIRRVAVVRYDAFPDMGGRLSFSAALLDEAGDGLVLTAINGRSETRSYAKSVTAGASEQQLSPEEQKAIHAAMSGEREQADTDVETARGRRGTRSAAAGR